MTTLHDQIAALPEWPPKDGYGTGFELVHCATRLGAALARLALARQWIATTDQLEHCATGCDYCRRKDADRDALLKALEVPR